MLTNTQRIQLFNMISTESDRSRSELYDKYLTKFLDKLVAHSTSVYLPETMPKEQQIDSLNLYTDTVHKFSSDIIESKNKMYEFDNVIQITTPKNFSETIASTIAEYVVVDKDVQSKYVENVVNQKVNSNESYESIYNFIQKEFSKEDFFDKQVVKDMAFKVKHVCALETVDVVSEIRHEVEENVKNTEAKNQIFRKALELIEERKDKLEEKNGVKTEEESTDDTSGDDNNNNSESSDNGDNSGDNSNEDSGNDNGDNNNNGDQSGESFISLENALVHGGEVDSSYFDIENGGTSSDSTARNIMSTSDDEDGDSVPEENNEELSEEEEGGEIETEDGGSVSEEDFCKLIAPKSLNKFINSPTINPKKLAQYVLTKEDFGNEFVSNIVSRMNYIRGLAVEEGLESFSGTGEVDPIYIKLHDITKSLDVTREIRDNATFDLQNIGFVKLDELNADEPFGQVVVDVLNGKRADSVESQMVYSAFRKNEINREIRAGRDLSRNLDKLGSVEEFMNETLDSLPASERNILESRLKSIQSLESSIDFSLIVDTAKIKSSMEKKIIAKDKEAFEMSGIWTDNTEMYKDVLSKLQQDKVVKDAAVNVDLDYVLKCALNGDNPCNSVFERILSKLRSAEGYGNLKEGQQYNVGKTILTTFVAANKLGFLSDADRHKLFTL